MEGRFDVYCSDLTDNIVNHVLYRTDANYFVSSVVYGHRYTVVFRATVKVLSLKTQMNAALSAHLQK